ncbi:unnamed protein product [Heligmosomoides polygyrus]|uniref:C2H2-type domain-containing protein n=1 Tax=Heligmosomoides polygyrus TaxID=6339 RepID=A0A3P7XLT0_HELPZ|nr:unnamed protein product [Heligmosomoides polygyrus]
MAISPICRADTCAACQAPLNSIEDFEKHTRSHVFDLYMRCAVCSQSIRNESQLALHCQFHMQKRSDVEEGEQTCGICRKVFSSPSALLSHCRTHSDSQRRCPLCGLSFNTASRFENHVRKHASTTNCICQICGDGFASRVVHDNDTLKVQEAIDAVAEWLTVWKLPPSFEKTQVFHLAERNCKTPYQIKGVVLKKVEKIRDLGF